MRHSSMRDFLGRLEQRGELRSIASKVDARYEISAL
jgi:UbiD family decarboxylase